jgi:hypothetical protein
LESDTFELVPNLIHVILNNNRIQFIGSNILKPLKKLQIISFGGNVCVQSYANYSEEQVERLETEIRLKCSDISMVDVMRRFDDLEKKLGEILRKVEEVKAVKKIEENFVIDEGDFVVELNRN